MDHEQDPRQAVRETYSGRGLTDSQLDESIAIANVIERGIRKSGSFHEKLTDYSHAFARSEQFDQSKGEAIIRDVFKAKFGETPNAMRERLLNREDHVRENQPQVALEQARKVEPFIRDGNTMPFYQAYDASAVEMARKLDITERGAKEMMKSAFEKDEGRDLYEHGKSIEKLHHMPRMEAERAERAQTQSEQPTQRRVMSRRR